MNFVPTSHSDIRTGMADDLETKLFGPLDPENAEVITIDPLNYYSTGILFPQKVLLVGLDEAEAETGETEQEVTEADLKDSGKQVDKWSSAASASDVSEPLNLANEFSPSALGLTFRTHSGARIIFRISAATYHEEANPEVPNRTVFRREPVSETVAVETGDVGIIDPIPITTPRGQLSLRLITRIDGDKRTISAMIVNDTVMPADKPHRRDCFFQVSLQVQSVDGNAVFDPIDKVDGGLKDEETEELDLLYRHRLGFALGHGVAADWNRDEKFSRLGRCDQLWTSSLPRYEVKPVVPRENTFGEGQPFELSMGFLFDGGGGSNPSDAILDRLETLADDYATWITERASDEIPDRLKPASLRNLGKCNTCLSRIKEGIKLLRKDAEAMLAFRLMNKVMFTQQHHSRLDARSLGDAPPKPAGDGSGNRWRPFQLGFILTNLASMGDPTHPDREMVELIWFPTGGGKTEAYLGLAAYAILLRRLRNEGGGTAVLMRYTLRLLTRQQFDRASAMIFALENMRRERTLGADLGDEPISIGLWVGQSLTPNRRADAVQKLRKLREEPRSENPFQILLCPWCRTNLFENCSGYVETRTPAGDKSVAFRCPEKGCGFHGDLLPIKVIDDDIFDAPPTLVIGTVDKFAQIAWESRTSRLFGIGIDEPPPSLIIQDELHLISGPLGTMVGLYEAAIDRLCSHDGTSPKIVASTATIRRAADQCKALYRRKHFEFPPQGNRANDSYFAFENQDAPGRLYVGFLGSALNSHQTALVRAASPLLQYPNRFDRNDDTIAGLLDPYGTLVWYFNTLRELGHAATLCAGDIQEYLKQLCYNDGIPPSDRRMFYDPAELTSRRTADEIPKILEQLAVPWRRGAANPWPVDILLATNMISVGVDIDRLGLMLVNGQPKGTSEYIQATSRVGRKHPGLVVVVYTQTKNRDRSHYERFVSYHQSLYRYVEPTSVTPFSPEARKRGMRGLLIAFARQLSGFEKPADISRLRDTLNNEVQFLLERISYIDKDELEDASFEISEWLNHWADYSPGAWGGMGGEPSEQTLMFPFGANSHPDFQEAAWPVMTSMRNVDGTSAARVLSTYPTPRESDASK